MFFLVIYVSFILLFLFNVVSVLCICKFTSFIKILYKKGRGEHEGQKNQILNVTPTPMLSGRQDYRTKNKRRYI